MNTYNVCKFIYGRIFDAECVETKVCHGLKEVWEYCGGKLFRERCGYCGNDGVYEYIAVRIK